MKKWKFGFLWVTLFLFLVSLVGHWGAGWYEYVKEQEDQNRPVDVAEYSVQMLRGTFENWQSEFLQLIWQVAGLSFLWYVGSPQSKEGDDRKEEKLDAILRALDPERADAFLKELETRYPRLR